MVKWVVHAAKSKIAFGIASVVVIISVIIGGINAMADPGSDEILSKEENLGLAVILVAALAFCFWNQSKRSPDPGDDDWTI